MYDQRFAGATLKAAESLRWRIGFSLSTKMICNRTKVFAIFVILVSAPAGLAQDKTLPEAYSGVAIGTGGSVGGKSIHFDFRITQYTSDEEVQNFAQLVKDKGTDALRSALEKEDRGRINVVGSTGNQIAVARKRQQGPDTIITIVTARTMPFSSSPEADAAVTTPSDIFR
jgi:hypothetical protein